MHPDEPLSIFLFILLLLLTSFIIPFLPPSRPLYTMLPVGTPQVFG